MPYIFTNNCNRNTPDCTDDVWILANVIEMESETWCQCIGKSHSHILIVELVETIVFMLLVFVWCVFVSWNNKFFQSIHDMFFVCSGGISKTWCEVKLFEKLNCQRQKLKKYILQNVIYLFYEPTNSASSPHKVVCCLYKEHWFISWV